MPATVTVPLKFPGGVNWRTDTVKLSVCVCPADKLDDANWQLVVPPWAETKHDERVIVLVALLFFKENDPEALEPCCADRDEEVKVKSKLLSAAAKPVKDTRSTAINVAKNLNLLIFVVILKLRPLFKLFVCFVF